MMIPLVCQVKNWLNAQISFSLRTSTLLILLAFVACLSSAFVRYRVTTRYSRLPRELDNDEQDDSAILSEMWNEPSDPESDGDSIGQNTAAASQLDDFLKAIKVFGYLESKVFNELTKSTQTLRVNKGEKVKLKDLGGFTVVIGGAMSVYCMSETSPNSLDLLNEIMRPAPISSLSSILSLFSDDIEAEKSHNVFEEVNETICAVATEPSTIVVIPAEAFRELKWKFTVATANIVQIILFRWSKITFRTCQRYLNLTQQFYGTERLLNDHTRNKRRKFLSDETVRGIVKQIKSQVAQAGFDKSIFQMSKNRVPSMSKPIIAEDDGKIQTRGRSLSGFSDSSRRSITPSAQSRLNLQKRNEKVYQDQGESPLSVFSDEIAGSFTPKHLDEMSAKREIVETMFSIVGLDVYGHPKRQKEIKKVASTMPGHFVPLAYRQRSSNSLESESETNSSAPDDLIDHTSERLELFWFRKGEYVSHYSDRSSGLIYVLDGSLEVRNHTGSDEQRSKKDQYLYDVNSGDITGFLETISSNTSFVDLIAKEDTCVAIIPKSCFDFLVDVDPLLYVSVAKTLTNNLSRPMVQLDFALEWISLKSGDRVLKQGAMADSIYFVLNGRLRAYQNKKVVGEFGYGSSIGELETMSGGKYKSTAIAVRDTEISRFPRSLIALLARQYPTITFEMSRMVVQAMNARDHMDPTQFKDIKTIAILPSVGGLPIEEFANKLSTAFQMNGKSVTVLTNAVILRYLGKYAFHKMGALKLKAYLGELEDRFDIILYVGDSNIHSSWTRTCINEAYMILLLVDGSATPFFSEVEKLVVKSPNRSMAHLILLHKEKQVKHGSTAKWLKHRPWISSHHHIQMPFALDEDHQSHDAATLMSFSPSTASQPSRVQKKIVQIKNRVQDEIKLLHHSKLLRKYTETHREGTAGLPFKNDFSRLARILSGEAVGLVLGGGGARGLSHIGVLQALEEAGVPVDMVGGTSIGSLIGGLYAKDYDIVPLLRKAKQFSARVSEFWRLIWDITYPMTAWTTGHEFNRAVWKVLGDSRIEDFWLQYFTNTTNLSLSKMDVHYRGYSWRYIRASMSLAGLLPPIEEKGHMLLDGGYVDNLPVNEMKKMGARYVLAIDVGAIDDTTHLNYGDTLSGFWALVNKYNPFSGEPNPPNIAEIQQRLTYVSSVTALEEAKTAEDVLYLRPPIDNYTTLDFSKFDEIRGVGYNYGTKALQKVIDDKKLPTYNRASSISKGKQMHYRRYSF